MAAAVKGPRHTQPRSKARSGRIQWLSRRPSLSFAQKAVDPARPLVAGEQPEKDDRALILLSDHQYYSAFDDNDPASAQQLASLIRRPVL